MYTVHALKHKHKARQENTYKTEQNANNLQMMIQKNTVKQQAPDHS